MGKFAEKAAEVLNQPSGIDWKARLAAQQTRMGTHMVSSQDEALAKAKALLLQLQDQAYHTGFGIRSQQHSHGNVEQLLERDENMPGVPGREHLINFPVKEAGLADRLSPGVIGAIGGGVAGAGLGALSGRKSEHPGLRAVAGGLGGATIGASIGDIVGAVKAITEARNLARGSRNLKHVGSANWSKSADWFESRLLSKEALMGFITDPLKNKYEDMMVNLRNSMNEKRLHGMRITSDPLTIPSFAPSVALSVPKSFVSGYQAADKAQAERLHGEMDQKLEKARQEFDNALKDEYAASHQKAASAGEFIDGLAQWWTKEADGEVNRVLGLYLAAAGLLGAGGHAATKSMWEKYDPRYQRLKAMQDMIKLRQRHTQLPVLVTEEHLPEEADETPLMGPPGNLGTEPSLSGIPSQAVKVGALPDPSPLGDLAGYMAEHARVSGGYRHLPGLYARSAKQAIADAIKPLLGGGAASSKKPSAPVPAKRPPAKTAKPLRVSYDDTNKRVTNMDKDANLKNVVSYAASEGTGRIIDHIGTKLSRHRKKHTHV